MNILSKSAKVLTVLSLGFLSTHSFAVDACNDQMPTARGNAHTVSGSTTGRVNGTDWGFEQWYQGGNNSMKYYDNGTFEASWSGTDDYLARVGYSYGNWSQITGIDHKTKHFAVDYKYTKQGNATYGYIGVYGWTKSPEVEYYIVDDWFSRPSEAYIGEKFGEITVDGAKYTIHAFLRKCKPAKSNGSCATFVQFFSVRETPRSCGHIDISAHFNKWEQLFNGKTARILTSDGNGAKDEVTMQFGKITEVMLMAEAGGGATGNINYTYFNMVDNAEGSTVTSSASTNSSSSTAQSQTAVGSLPGTIEIEDYQNSDGDFKNNGTTLGSINPDSWVEYTVNVTYDGTYDFSVLAAREDEDGAESNLSISIDGTPVGTIDGILTTSWTDFQEFSGTTAKLTKGQHTLRVTFDYGWIDIDKISFTEKQVDKTTPYVPPSSPSQGNVNSSGSSKAPAAIASNVRLFHAGKDVQVFDMQGKFLGSVSIANGGNVAQAVKARVQKAGVYLVKQGSSVQRIAVK